MRAYHGPSVIGLLALLAGAWGSGPCNCKMPNGDCGYKCIGGGGCIEASWYCDGVRSAAQIPAIYPTVPHPPLSCVNFGPEDDPTKMEQ